MARARDVILQLQLQACVILRLCRELSWLLTVDVKLTNQMQALEGNFSHWSLRMPLFDCTCSNELGARCPHVSLRCLLHSLSALWPICHVTPSSIAALLLQVSASVPAYVRIVEKAKLYIKYREHRGESPTPSAASIAFYSVYHC